VARAPNVLASLESYQHCSKQIASSMADPRQEGAAFTAVSQNALIVAQFYQFSKELEAILPKLLLFLGKSPPAGEGHRAVTQNTGVARRLAEALEFVLLFDQAKMLRPEVQNDFAFYRRALSKHTHDHELTVRDDDASFISLFLANPVPMLQTVAKAVSTAHADYPDISKVLAAFANVMVGLLKTGAFDASDRTNVLLLRAMVGSVAFLFFLSFF
jgi:hypothetical protein